MESQEEKKAKFLENARANQARFELHKQFLKKAGFIVDILPDEDLLRLIDYAESYSISLPQEKAVEVPEMTDEVLGKGFALNPPPLTYEEFITKYCGIHNNDTALFTFDKNYNLMYKGYMADKTI